MSRLIIKDLERIKNGKVVKYNLLTTEKYSSLVSLDRVQKQINEFNKVRFHLLKQFRDDMIDALEWKKGCKIDSTYSVSFDRNRLFSNGYLVLTIPTMLGNSTCLFDKNGLVGAEGEITRELINKANIITPYVKKILNLKDKSNVVSNAFYEDYPVLNNKYEKVFNINGNGVTLPFHDYTELDNVQDILNYYYCNQEEILQNVIIPNTRDLEKYKLDTYRDKVLKLYKGEK